MQKLVLTFGGIAGAIVTLFMLVSFSLIQGKDGKPDFQTGEILGYVSMIVSLSMIYFGIRSYRDNHLNGRISFGKAFQVGILIALVASVIYALGWLVYFHLSESAKQFPEQYLAHMSEKMQANGKPQANIDAQIESYRQNMELYKNPFVMFGMSLIEIFPVGLLLTLLSAFILKKKG